MDSRPKQGKSQHNKCLQRSTIYKVLLYLTDLVRSYVRQHSDHSACQSLNKSDSRNLERSLNAVPWLRRLGLHGSDSIREPLLWVSDFSDFKSRWSYLRRFKTPPLKRSCSLWFCKSIFGTWTLQRRYHHFKINSNQQGAILWMFALHDQPSRYSGPEHACGKFGLSNRKPTKNLNLKNSLNKKKKHLLILYGPACCTDFSGCCSP